MMNDDEALVHHSAFIIHHSSFPNDYNALMPTHDDPALIFSRLVDVIRPRRRVLTAYSGGVDSTLVAFAAKQALGRDHAPAVLGDSASLPRHEFVEAQRIAAALGLLVEIVNPGEQTDDRYQANAADRCFFCKTHLYATLSRVAAERGIGWIANGTNADDPGDHRPGLAAAAEAGVISPLLEAGMNKQQVRRVARHVGLPNWDKPAAACLASRIPHGTPVTPERLNRVECAEAALRELGFTGFRVRDHETVARIEVPLEQLPRLVERAVRERAVAALKEAGYRYVSLDLEGFRSGSGNPVQLSVTARA